MVEKKTIEQFRTELVDAIHITIKRETINSVSFIKKADYFRAKLAEAKIDGLNTALGIIIDAAAVKVK